MSISTKALLIRALVMMCVITLAACASPQIYHRQLVSLNKGMTEAQASSSLQLTPLSTYSTTVGDTAYTFQRYYLNNGMNRDLYLLCFESSKTEPGKLKYWGYIEEFRRYPDARINQALENVLPEIRASVK